MKSVLLQKFSLVRVLAVAILGSGLMTRHLAAQDAVEPTPIASALPAGILPGSPLSQVIKLSQAGVDEGIIQTFITNSASTFNLDSEKIIYLKDAGIPNVLVTTMMQHDTVLQLQIAAATPPPLTPTPTAAPVPDASQPPPVDTQTPDVTEPPVNVISVSDFYNTLSPYGNWVVVDGIGSCWLPGVAIYNHDWQPYGDHGHWVYTDSGWYWASDYSWGWAPFHYGRWFHSRQFGWCWHPDTTWGPSWVTWRYENDYCGWAPLPPGAYYRDGAGFVYNGNAVSADFDFGLAADAFIFVGVHDFCDPHPFRHRIDHDRAVEAYHRSTIINSYDHDHHGFVNHGIDPDRITRVTHTAIRPVPLHNGYGQGGNFPRHDISARNNEPTSPNHLGNPDNRGTRTAPGHNQNFEPSPNAPVQYNQPQPTVTVIGGHNNRPVAGATPMPNRTPQTAYPQPHEPYNAPAAEPAHFNTPTPPTPQPRPSAPVYHTGILVSPPHAETTHSEPPHLPVHESQARPAAPAWLPPTPAPQPAQVHNNSPQPGPATSRAGNNSDQKKGPH